MLDGEYHKIRAYMVGNGGFTQQLINLVDNNLIFGTAARRPGGVGDIVARDLESFVGESLGHIGFWDGANVIEVLNESTVVQTNSWASFRAKATQKTWDSLTPKMPDAFVTTCFENSCIKDDGSGAFGGGAPSQYNYTSAAAKYAMAKRALQIRQIGATYTYTSYPTYAVPAIKDGVWTRLPIRGNYRCDTFILDLYATTDIPDGYSDNFVWGSSQAFPYKKKITSSTPTWKNRMNTLFTATGVAPVIIYNRIKTFN